MKVTLAPVIHEDRHTTILRRPLLAYFEEVLIRPLAIELVGSDRENALAHVPQRSALEQAILGGVVEYEGGAFTGDFNSVISRDLSRIGARFDARSRKWTLSLERVPLEVRTAIYQAKDDAKGKLVALVSLLGAMQSNAEQADTGIDITKEEATILSEAQRVFVKSAADAGILVYSEVPESFKQTARVISEAAAADAKRAFLAEVARLRAQLEKAQTEGASLIKLEKIIEASKRRMANTANAIAEHSAAMLLSEFREQQYKRLGATGYVWKTMRDDRVRPGHRQLEGTNQTWDNPPVTNPATGARNNPGEDINCRCVPLPIINIPE